jgi:hypothetical protein
MNHELRDTCKRALEDVVDHAGGWFSSCAVEEEGTADEFIHGFIQPGDIEFWIGSASTEYAVGSESYRFELSSYESVADLVREFSSELAEDLREAMRSQDEA